MASYQVTGWNAVRLALGYGTAAPAHRAFEILFFSGHFVPESRMTGCEDRAEQSQNQFLESESKANEYATRLESAEHMIDKQAEGLVQANQSMKAAADKIQNLEEFQAATEKFGNSLFAALSNVEGTRSEESLEAGPKSRRLNEPLSIKELNQVSALAKRVTGRV